MFDDMNDDQFFAWLAGFFDGEGCLYFRTNRPGFEITIANTDKAVIVGIRDRLKIGVIQEVTYSKENWKTKYAWRVRNYNDCEIVLRPISKFVTVKRNKVISGLARIDDLKEQRKKQDERNMEIVSLAKSGKRYREIAVQFNLSYRTIAMICQGHVTSAPIRADVWNVRHYKSNFKKKTSKVSTKSTGLQ